MSDSGQLPISSDSQNIGARADKCFGARCPENWRPQNVGGTDDFGIDYQVQTIENNQATDMFRVQLKGTTVPVLNAENTQFSVPLKTSTVRYYARFTEPILLVLCDLSVSARAIDCPLYFVWIHGELKRVDTRGLPDEQVSVTLHVPKSNILNEDTNLSQDLEQFRTLAKIGGSLNVTLEKQNPSLDASSRLSLLEKLPRGFAERSTALIESLAEEPTSAWPTRPVDSMPWFLSEIDHHLVNADFKLAKEMLVQAEPQLLTAKTIELGEYWHLTGRLYLLSLDQAEACRAFKRAAEAAPSNVKHLAAWAKTEMAVRFCIDGPNNFDDIYPLLTSSAPEILAVKARLLAAENKDEEAEEILRSFTGPEQLSTKAVFRTMRARWQEAIDVCDQGTMLPNVKQATRLLFMVLKAKAQFHLAVDHDEPSRSHIRLPLTGRPNSNLALLSTSWDGMKAAMEALRSAGWPANTEFIADIIAAAASMLQREEEGLSLLAAAAEKRENMPVLQASVESLAAQTKKYDVALAANLRQPANPTTKLRRAFLLHMMNRDNDCVSFFEANLDSFDQDDPMYAETLTAAIISSDRLVRADLIKKWSPLFDATPKLIVHRCIMNYALDRAKKSRAEALSTLYERFNEHQHPVGIAIQLFYDFNAQRDEEAKKIIELSVLLAEHRLPSLDAVIQLSQAYATLNRWDDLLLLMSKERGRFAVNQTLVAVESLALDRLGRTAEAKSLLAPLIANGATEQFVLGTYVDIMIRCGFIEEAIQTAEIMAAAEKNNSKKREHLRVLHNLVRANNPSDLRAHDIAWRIGALTDPMDEVNEGVFLMTIMISPHPEDPDPAQLGGVSAATQ
jgi:tetratricopeptide (TPR) repeat protein